MVSRFYDITVSIPESKMNAFAKELLDWALELKYERFCFSYFPAFKEELPAELWKFKKRELPSGMPSFRGDFTSDGRTSKAGKSSSQQMVFEGKLCRESADALLKIVWGGPDIDRFKAYATVWEPEVMPPSMVAKCSRVRLSCTNHEHMFGIWSPDEKDVARVRAILKKIGLKAEEREKMVETVELFMDAIPKKN